jgi:hypothetical protein
MAENEIKPEKQNCCCGCWKYILIAIIFLAIGFFAGHFVTMHHHWHHMKGFDGMKACWHHDRDRECCEHKCMKEKEECQEHKGCSEHKADMDKCKQGCTCPKCAKKAASVSEPNKPASPPMMNQMQPMPKKE